MDFIRIWSYKCAHFLTKQLNENHEKRGVYYYGFQIVIGGIVKMLMLIALSLLTGTFKQTMIVMLFFVSLRIITGGYHMDTYSKCIITSLVMFISGGILVKYTYMYWSTTYLLLLIIATFSMALFGIVTWVPADTPNKPIKKPEQKRKFKSLSTVHIIIWLALTSVLLYYKINMFVLGGCTGILLAVFISSPAGYFFFNKISGKMNMVEKVGACK